MRIRVLLAGLLVASALCAVGCRKDRPAGEGTAATAQVSGVYRYPTGEMLSIAPDGTARIAGPAGSVTLTWTEKDGTITLTGQGGGVLRPDAEGGATFTPAGGGQAFRVMRRQ